jgi:hypothetical protein
MANEIQIPGWYVGALLDAWERLPNDSRQVVERDAPALATAVNRIRIAAESDTDYQPLNAVLPCPACGLLHVDAPEPENEWTNPPHKSHLCHGCGVVWRPADVPTNGVARAETRGERDTWPTDQTQRASASSGDNSPTPQSSLRHLP